MLGSFAPWLIGLGAVVGAGCVLALAGALGSVGIEKKGPEKAADGSQAAPAAAPGEGPGFDRVGDHRRS